MTNPNFYGTNSPEPTSYNPPNPPVPVPAPILTPGQIKVIEQILLKGVAGILGALVANAASLSPTYGVFIGIFASDALAYVNGLLGQPIVTTLSAPRDK